MRNGQQHNNHNNHKRMRGRNRRSGGGHNPLTRVYESNGPDVKIRGTAHHVAEKYLQLARDAQSSGDPVSGENYLQHAEHYFRLIAAAQLQLQQQNPNMQQAPYQRPDEAREDGDEDGDDSGDEQPYVGGAPVQQQNNAPRPQPQNMPQPNIQPRDAEGGLPAFITGGAPQQGGNFNSGQENEQGDNRGGRFNNRNNRGRNRFRPRGPNEFENRGDQTAQPAEAAPAAAPVPAKSESAE
jgi:hypothetical protein